MATFSPNPGDILPLFNEEFAVEPHPRVPSMAYGQEGGRGTIYKICNKRRQAYALKVLKRRARNGDQVAITNRLQAYSGIRGLRAAYRRIVPSDDQTVRAGLAGALLMPWIDGQTWFDILQRAKAVGECVDRETAVQLCQAFLEVVTELEARGAAHTDVASGNVVVDLASRRVELIDLEEVFDPACAADALVVHARTPGYSRRYDDDSLWSADSDRFAAAVLAAEMLVLTRRELARLSNGESFFDPEVVAGRDAGRYASAFQFLQHEFPRFWQAFYRSWHAKSLSDCPRVAELRASIDHSPVSVTGVGASQTDEHVRVSDARAGHAAARAAENVVWKPIEIPTTPRGVSVPPSSKAAQAPWAGTQPELPAGGGRALRRARGQLLAYVGVVFVVAFILAYYLTDKEQKAAEARARIAAEQSAQEAQRLAAEAREAQRLVDEKREAKVREEQRAQASRAELVVQEEKRIRVAQEEAARAAADGAVLERASPSIAAQLVQAIRYADAMEIEAYSTLDTRVATRFVSGEYLRKMRGSVRELIARNEYEVNRLIGQTVESALVSRDRTKAQVSLKEVWETTWHDRTTGACLRYLHRIAIPQTAYLKSSRGGWTVDKVDTRPVPATVGPCR